MNDWLAWLPAWPWIDPARIDPQWIEATGWFFIGYFVLLTLLYLVLMLPIGMVKLVVSVRHEDEFGFGPRRPAPAETAPPAAGETQATA